MIFIALMALLSIWALVDVVRTPAEMVTAPGKLPWALLVVVPAIGPLAWMFGGRRDTPLPTAVPVRPVAPDDDPDFLRGLDDHPED